MCTIIQLPLAVACTILAFQGVSSQHLGISEFRGCPSYKTDHRSYYTTSNNVPHNSALYNSQYGHGTNAAPYSAGSYPIYNLDARTVQILCNLIQPTGGHQNYPQLTEKYTRPATVFPQPLRSLNDLAGNRYHRALNGWTINNDY